MTHINLLKPKIILYPEMLRLTDNPPETCEYWLLADSGLFAIYKNPYAGDTKAGDTK
jgi:hypothetical protein